MLPLDVKPPSKITLVIIDPPFGLRVDPEWDGMPWGYDEVKVIINNLKNNSRVATR